MFERGAEPPFEEDSGDQRMRFEVELAQEDSGLFRATAVVYPEVTVTGRTEKEALGLLMEALERYMRKKSPGAP
jgi:hypothetical protein